MNFKDVGSYGLRQFGGWMREEFLPQLQGREAARVYREMRDNSATVGGLLFAITQAMRKVEWRVQPATDTPDAKAAAEFVNSLRDDMSHTWEDFIDEALSMLPFGYSIHETVYKRRIGRRSYGDRPTSRYNDGLIGLRRLPIRGQETILKWFFDANGQITGVTQQPWVGAMIDLPIEKFVLFRPSAHKGNPEGRSILRNAYQSYYFVKRLQEQEAILFERMSGLPVMYVPSTLTDQANAVNPNGSPANPGAVAALAAYKKIVTNLRIDEQMGVILPSDPYVDADGKPTSIRQYQLELMTPQHGTRGGLSADVSIARYKTDIMTTVLADFLVMGHEVRGTNNLAVTKVDMFYASIEGWLNNIAAVLNRYLLPRVWRINNLPPDLMPEMIPDMAQRLDLDGLGGFIANIAAAGVLVPDDDLENWIREAAGMPEATDPDALGAASGNSDLVKRMVLGSVAKRVRMRRAGMVAA
jgi:hypothetical protein